MFLGGNSMISGRGLMDEVAGVCSAVRAKSKA
jgi:hypothetical protein